MKNYKNWKKIIYMSAGLVAVGSIASVSAVSCSSSKIPEIATSIKYVAGGDTFVRESNGVLKLETPKQIGNDKVEYTPTIPSKDDANRIEKLKLLNQMNVIDLFTSWFQSMCFNFGELIATSFNNQGANNEKIFNQLTGDKKLIAIALATPLNSSYKTIRYGLKQINLSVGSIPNPKVETDPCNIPLEGDKNDPTKYTDDDSNVSINGVSLTFGWWDSTNGTTVNWKDANFDPTTQDTQFWNKWIDKGVITKQDLASLKDKTLQVSGSFDCKLSPQAMKEKQQDGSYQWKYNGVYNILNGIDNPFIISGNNEQESKDVYNFFNEVCKRIRGDVLNSDWIKYVVDNSTIATKALAIFGISI